jgi:hypothetical protein
MKKEVSQQHISMQAHEFSFHIRALVRINEELLERKVAAPV